MLNRSCGDSMSGINSFVSLRDSKGECVCALSEIRASRWSCEHHFWLNGMVLMTRGLGLVGLLGLAASQDTFSNLWDTFIT